jgi:hypothetical protein
MTDGDGGQRIKRRARWWLPAVITLLMLGWIAFIVVLIASGAKPG